MAFFSAVSAAGGAAAGVINVGRKIFGGGTHKLNKAAYKRSADNKVTVFDDAAYNGYAKTFAPGEHVWLGIGGRDELSSVKVPPGLKLEMWTGSLPSAKGLNDPNANPGEKVVFTESTRYIGDQWNDAIDSVRVSYTDEAKEVARKKELKNEPWLPSDYSFDNINKAGGSNIAVIVAVLTVIGVLAKKKGFI